MYHREILKMSFERSENFKISLSKSVDVLSSTSDLLKGNKHNFLLKEKFKLEALVNQDPEQTDYVYKTARGQNVSATFEKLHREVLDLQFASAFLPRLNFAPVIESSAKSGPWNSEREVSFKTNKDRRRLKIKLIISSRPKSVVFPDAIPPKFIQFKLSKKIPASLKLKDAFDQFMNGGGLLVDFIMDSIWPAMIKTDEMRRDELLNQEEQIKSTKLPESSRTFAGKDRGVGRKFESRRDGRDNHRSNFQPSHRKEERNMNDKGDRIPRHNSKFSQPESSRGPMHQKPPSRNPEHILTSLNLTDFVAGGMMGRSLHQLQKDNLSEMVPNGPKEYHSELQLKGFGKPKRRSKSRRPNRASDSDDWRKPTE